MSNTVDVVVSDAQKSFWKQHAEENPKYDHLSDLVRTAVAEQIARDKGETGVPDEVEDMMYEILDEFSSLQSKIVMANETLDTIQNNQLDEEAVEDVVGFHREMIEDELENLNRSEDEGTGHEDA